MQEGFRQFLETLATDVKIIDKEVDTKHEIAAYIRKSSDLGGPAFLFNHVRNYPGWRAAGGIFGSRKRILSALRTTPGELVSRFADAREHRLDPLVVESGPCKETVWEGAEADLTRIPIPTHCARDVGPFITAGLCVARDPSTGARGMGVHRMQVKGPRRLGISISGQRRLSRYLARSEDLGRPLEMAVAVGVDPCLLLASQAKVPHDVDKYGIAGSLLGHPVELITCESIDVEVPAHAELVIEGEVEPGIREEEGPFGEFTGCYVGVRKLPIFTVKTITMRSEPIFLTVLCGMPVTENHLMVWPAMSEIVYRAAQMACPEVQGVNLTGNHYYTAVVSIRKRTEGEPRNVIHAVLGGSLYPKYCIVVDEDIDIYDAKDVEWAIQTRVQPHQDVVILPPMIGAVLDPSAPKLWHTSKMGIDATIPLDVPREKFEKARVPGAESVTW